MKKLADLFKTNPQQAIDAVEKRKDIGLAMELAAWLNRVSADGTLMGIVEGEKVTTLDPHPLSIPSNIPWRKIEDSDVAHLLATDQRFSTHARILANGWSMTEKNAAEAACRLYDWIFDAQNKGAKIAFVKGEKIEAITLTKNSFLLEGTLLNFPANSN